MQQLLAGAEIDWNSLLHRDPGLAFLVSLGLAALVALTAIIAVQWRKTRQVDSEARLKELMIQRGFTSTEITSVIAASLSRKRESQSHRSRTYPDPLIT